jgi:hypothetical protein
MPFIEVNEETNVVLFIELHYCVSSVKMQILEFGSIIVSHLK